MENNLKQKILEFIQENGHVTFAELSNHIPDFNGEYEFLIAENVALWVNMSKEACEAIEELRADKKIEFNHTTLIVYFVDGAGLKLPIAKTKKKYKKLHWLPVVMNPIQKAG